MAGHSDFVNAWKPLTMRAARFQRSPACVREPQLAGRRIACAYNECARRRELLCGVRAFFPFGSISRYFAYDRLAAAWPLSFPAL